LRRERCTDGGKNRCGGHIRESMSAASTVFLLSLCPFCATKEVAQKYLFKAVEGGKTGSSREKGLT